jgi:SAM-dependent methyltransferase
MRNWRNYWEVFPKSIGEKDFLKQVGKTVGGKEISGIQFQEIILEISERLDINKNDEILDLCCGNGLITCNIAKICRSILGIDYSSYLIDIARLHHNPDNTCYIVGDVLNITPFINQFSKPFQKIYMYEALQHFRKADFYRLLKVINEISADDVLILFGSVPDWDMIFGFYDTPKRRLEFIFGSLLKRQAIGTWWDKNYIGDVSRSLGFDCTFFQQNDILHTSHYRFDVLVSRHRN